MERRGISRKIADAVLDAPQQIVMERDSLIACQSQVRFEDGQLFLVRLIVNPLQDPAVVVTVCRTSKIAKYWRGTV